MDVHSDAKIFLLVLVRYRLICHVFPSFSPLRSLFKEMRVEGLLNLSSFEDLEVLVFLSSGARRPEEGWLCAVQTEQP